MSVRKRKWTTAKGELREAWIVDYVDQQGDRHIETFTRKKEADDYHKQVGHEVNQGVHTAPSKSITVAQAADDWICYIEGERRERSTIDQYRQHVRHHIIPRLGRERLARLTAPRVNTFRDELINNMSRAMAKKVLGSLKAILKEATRRGNVAQNVAADVSITTHGRTKPKLEIGRDIPTRTEVQRIIVAAGPRKGRALLMTAALTGMRASELRGLRWADLDLAKRVIRVRQRADRYGRIGHPKSAAGTRAIPIGDMVVNMLREWRLACPKGLADLVFPTGIGTIESHANIVNRIFNPAQMTAGVLTEGKPKYGLHAMRHFYASWCINLRKDGGLELPPKTVQTRLGHASIVMTLDRYGHLFPNHDDGTELAAAEQALFAT